MTKTMEAEIRDEKPLYELAFLLSPLVAEDKVETVLSETIRASLAAVGAEIQSQEGPKMISLAYPLKRVLDNKGTIYRQAYFGVIYFKAASGAVANLEAGVSGQASWQRLPELVRYLLIKRSPGDIERQINAAKRAALAPKEDQVDKLDQEAIDKEIDDLVADVPEGAVSSTK